MGTRRLTYGVLGRRLAFAELPGRVEIVLSHLVVLTGRLPFTCVCGRQPHPQDQFLFRGVRKNHPCGVTRFPCAVSAEDP
jgi:hypothetical protein